MRLAAALGSDWPWMRRPDLCNYDIATASEGPAKVGGGLQVWLWPPRRRRVNILAMRRRRVRASRAHAAAASRVRRRRDNPTRQPREYRIFKFG